MKAFGIEKSSMSSMKFILDTSAYSEFNRGDFRLRKFFVASNEILVPLIVVGELRAGFAAGNRRSENEKLLRRFLDSPSVQTVSLTDKTTLMFSEIYLSLRNNGTPIGTNDLWVAAICKEYGQPLLTLDADFNRVPAIKLLEV